MASHRRQEGKIKVPDRIRFPEKSLEISSTSLSLSLDDSLPWLQSLIDTPSFNDIFGMAGIFTALGTFIMLISSSKIPFKMISRLEILWIFRLNRQIFHLWVI